MALHAVDPSYSSAVAVSLRGSAGVERSRAVHFSHMTVDLTFSIIMDRSHATVAHTLLKIMSEKSPEHFLFYHREPQV